MTNSGLETRDQEMIAAFIDRRMSDEERQAFMGRLDADEALYEVFVETVRFRDQEEGRPATVVPHPASRARWVAPATVAALLAVAVATTVLLRSLADEGYGKVLVANARLEPALGADWHVQGWSRTRGINSTVQGADAAFRVGVQAVDLEIALRLGRDEDAAILTHGLERSLRGLDFSEPLQALYSTLRDDLEAGATREETLALGEQAESGFAELFSDLGDAYRLGRWAEAGRLAARSANRELLSSRPFNRTLRSLRRPDAPWDPVVAAQLETIGGQLDDGGTDLGRLETAFETIIDEG